MFEIREKPELVERALLVGIYFDPAEAQNAQSLLDELVELVNTLEIPIVKTLLVKARDRHARFLCGTGKADEIKQCALDEKCDCVIFDNMLAPSQQRAWEEQVGVTVLDREEVILDIFAKRAKSREAQLQVDLARMQYALPRMARMWSHLDRQGGGSGGGKGGASAARGEGEKQIEVDRRLARNRIDHIKGELEEVIQQRKTQRKERERQGLPHASIVGYTNAGKSTLLNILTGSNVLAKDMLFATLDTTTRKIELPDGQPLLLTDTVGFIRNLPHRLVESFKATLEETVLSDFLIHILDASNPEVMECHDTTLRVLAELGLENKPILTVLNKIDLIEDPTEKLLMEHQFRGSVIISAKDGMGLENLLARCAEMLAERIHRVVLNIPMARGDLLALIHREGKVLSTKYPEGMPVTRISALVPNSLFYKFEAFLAEEKPGEE